MHFQNIVTREMADKEEQLNITNHQYAALQTKLEEMLLTIAKETEDIKKLEQELREGIEEWGSKQHNIQAVELSRRYKLLCKLC